MPAFPRRRSALVLGPFASRKAHCAPFPIHLATNHVNRTLISTTSPFNARSRETCFLKPAYLGNLGHKIGGPNVNINMIPLVNGQDRRRRARRCVPSRNTTTSAADATWGNSTYHALNLKVESRYSSGLNFLANYTWSKFLDNVEAGSEFAGGEGNGYTHNELRGLDRSYAGNDIVTASSEAVIRFPDGQRQIG